MKIFFYFMESGQVLHGNENIFTYLDNLNFKEIFRFLKPVFDLNNIRFKDVILHSCNFKYHERLFIVGLLRYYQKPNQQTLQSRLF